MGSPDEEIVRLLSDPANRAVLTVLDDATERLTVAELAEAFVSERAMALSPSEYERRLEGTRTTLHHSRLPRLDDAGLIEYDREELLVGGTDSPRYDTDSPGVHGFEDILGQFRPDRGTEGNAIGVLESEAAVYDYGRELADGADEELFLIYASDDLLDEACLPHAENAIARGVDVYAGAKGAGARQFFRESLPAATVWEPQLDWMNRQTGYPRVSRLIFADRETVVVGLRDARADGESHTEIGMVGEGRHSPLVVLVRELLGPRLDHLDYQSDDFLEGLPFES